MSIWPQAMSYLRPSSDVDLVSPVIACLVAVYGAEFGTRRMRRDRSVVDDAPPRGVWSFIIRIACLRAQERAGEVDVDDVLPLRERQLFEVDRRRAHARVVEQHVETPEGVAFTFSNSAATDAGSATSVGTANALAASGPVSCDGLARAARGGGRQRQRDNRSCRSATAAALPMPVPAPVTISNFLMRSHGISCGVDERKRVSDVRKSRQACAAMPKSRAF